MKFRHIADFEGNIFDHIAVRVRGEGHELLIFSASPMWGPVKSRPVDWPSPTALADTVSVRQWQYSSARGHDFRLRHLDGNWRLLTLPDGFAEYKNVPAKAAEQFDRILDSLCDDF